MFLDIRCKWQRSCTGSRCCDVQYSNWQYDGRYHTGCSFLFSPATRERAPQESLVYWLLPTEAPSVVGTCCRHQQMSCDTSHAHVLDDWSTQNWVLRPTYLTGVWNKRTKWAAEVPMYFWIHSTKEKFIIFRSSQTPSRGRQRNDAKPLINVFTLIELNIWIKLKVFNLN